MNMDFFELVQKRRACHHFKAGVDIPDSDIFEILEYVRNTPSGYNAQPWDFIVVRERERLKKIQEIAFDQPHLTNASAVVIVLGDLEIGRNVDQLLKDWLRLGYCTEEEIPAYRNSIAKRRSEDKRQSMALRNSMLAAMTFIFAAEDKGYATCPMMGFSQHQLIDFLNIPDDRMISLMIALGKPDEGKGEERLPRREVEDMLHWETFKS